MSDAFRIAAVSYRALHLKYCALHLKYCALHEEMQVMSDKLTCAREWVGLTDEEVKQCSYDAAGFMIEREVAMRAAEAKLKEKNT